MTTANLSVGINTKSAEQGLARLKALMKSELGSVKISVDAASVDDVRKALKGITAKVTLDSASLTRDVHKALDAGFGKTYQVKLDTANLTSQVQAALTAGMGAKLQAGAAPVASSPVGLDIKTAIQQILVPAVDELSKAAILVGGTARKIGAGGSSNGNLSASSRFSSVDPTTGERLSVTRKLDAPEIVLGRVRQDIAAERVRKEQDALNKEGARVGPDWTALNAARDRADAFRRRRAEAEQAALNKEGAQFGPDWNTLTAARDRAAAQRRRDAAAEQNALNKEGAQFGPDWNTLTAARDRQAAFRRRRAEAEQAALNKEGAQFGPDWNTLTAARDRAAAQRRLRAEAEQNALNKEGAQFGPDWNTLTAARDRQAAFRRRRAEAEQEALNREGAQVGPDWRTLTSLRDRAAALRRRDAIAEQDALNREGASFGPSRQTLLAAVDRARVEARAKAAAQAKLDIASFYENAKVDAAKSFTGAGVKISAASATAAQFGAAPTAAFLGKDAGLLGRVSDLDAYRKAAANAGDATKLLRSHMGDAHSAARGLAGSMGALWTTWGSTVPIVAAAAIGGALRSVFTVGKDVEFQLRFVQVLSDNTIVSIKDFGSAVRGSLTIPTEAAAGMRGLAQNGLNVRQALQALPEILNLATAGEMSLSEAALGATGVMAAFNLQVTDLGRVGDVFAKAASISNTSVAGMVESMKTASTVSDQYNVGLEETAATLAVLAKRNITGTAAGTAFRNMMVELATPHQRARDAMKQMGLQLYDTSNQLRGYGDVLTELRNKTLSLNEKGRLTFLNDVFGERGAKAANAILSDFSQYQQMLDQIQNKSKGFSASVTEALKETTQGKVKALVTEFQLSAVQAFESASGSVNHFLDTLRAGVSSEEFRTGLKGLINAVASLTTFLVEHGKTVVATIAIWQGARILEGAVTGFLALRAAVQAASVAMAGARVVALSVLGAMTGGVALVAALAAEYFLLHGNTNGATEAQRAFQDQLVLSNQTLDNSIERLTKSNQLLQRRIELQQQGYSGAQADSIMSNEEAKGKGKDYQAQIQRAQADLEAAKKRLADQVKLEGPGSQGSQGGLLISGKSGTVSALESDILRLQGVLEMAKSAAQKFNQELSLKQSEEFRKSLDKRLDQVKQFNDRLYEIRTSNKKANLDGLFITQGEAKTGGDDAFKELMRQRTEELNKRLGSYTPKNPEARRDDLAASRKLISELHDEQSELQQYLRFRKELDEAKYNPNLFGPYISATLAEQRAINGTSAELRMQAEWIDRLKKAKNSANFNDADRTALQAEIEKEETKFRLANRALEQQKQLAAVKSENRAREEADKFGKTQAELNLDATQINRGIRDSYSNKVLNPSDEAASRAAVKVDEKFGPKILAQQLEVNTARESERLLLLQKAEILATYDRFDREALAAADAGLEAAQKDLSVQETRLAILRAQATAASDSATALARSQQKQSETAEYGFNRFWKEYQEQGLTAAKVVESAMKSSSDKMADAIGGFVTTGKLHFKSLVASMLADLAKLEARKAFGQLLSMAANWAISSGGSSGGYSGSAGNEYGVTFGKDYAKGGIMTPWGDLPLRKYDAGGIARSPQAAIYGEGKKPEAYVPLEDGRTIPVTVSGAGGGVTSVNVEVHIHSDGRSEVDSDASGMKAAQLGRLVEQAVTERIVKERRPGGLLYS